MSPGLSRSASAPIRSSSPERRAVGKRSPWVWWHLLSLDAPTVAIVWCWFFGAALHLHFRWTTLPTLALGTWCVYVADRLLDGWRSGDTASLRDRHWFYLRHRRPFIFAWAVAAVPLAYLIFFRVESAVRTDDVLLCLIGVAYFLLIHARSSRGGEARLFPRWFPKEMAVGFLFAIAAAVPAWAHLTTAAAATPVRGVVAAAIFSFGTVCWLNCVAIQTWEDTEAAQEIVHAILSRSGGRHLEARERGLTEFLGAHLTVFAATVGTLAAAFAFATAGSAVALLFAAATLSACLFLALIRFSHRMSALSLRIAADAALLTPLLLLLQLR